MTEDKGILIRNIYYMLAYAFRDLKQLDQDKIGGEKFEYVQDLFVAILATGTARQIKRGLYREYVPEQEILPVLRGKLDVASTVKCRLQRRQKLGCLFDTYSVNNLYNRILKTAMYVLIRCENVNPKQKAELKKLLLFFGEADILEPAAIPWHQLHFRRDNRHYELLLNVCYFILHDMLQTTETGSFRMAKFSDDNMSRLYEKFVLRYYQYHYSGFLSAKDEGVAWNLDGERDKAVEYFLPAMYTDITLRSLRSKPQRVLIIDTKYYGKSMQEYYGKRTLHSHNLYQVFTYVKNMDRAHTGRVSGLLLYARTNESLVPDFVYSIGGNRIGAKTLDLNRDFSRITAQLDKIVRDFFPEDCFT